ncbi:MAG: septum formation protein Maf [Candidatus Omnitrophica bacterium]|nr:septum formation protein Maf [Candidatus Omnitrophota bacterium]
MIVLASQSSRRSQILSSCGIRHKVVVSGIAETSRGMSSVPAIVVNNAKAKAKEVSKRYKSAIVIGADTLVRLDKQIIGKPRNKAEAMKLLAGFSARSFYVYTGLCVIDTATGRMSSGYERSIITAKKMSRPDINRYFKVLAPYDKAGGFSIEGAGSLIFDNIKGSYFNILGLPMMKLADLFQSADLNILDYIK